MKLEQLIAEESEFSVAKIIKDCEPWFEENWPDRKIVWHGTTPTKKDVELIRNRVRENPSNSSKQLHDTTNRILKTKFGWNPRSEGLFVSGDEEMSMTYGKVYACFPIGDFKYVWSPDVEDLFFYWRGYLAKNKGLHISEITRKFAYDLENSVKWKDDDLDQAIQSGHEIIINAKSFYLVDTTSKFYQNELKPAIKKI